MEVVQDQWFGGGGGRTALIDNTSTHPNIPHPAFKSLGFHLEPQDSPNKNTPY